jgi:hypothetical protein
VEDHLLGRALHPGCGKVAVNLGVAVEDRGALSERPFEARGERARLGVEAAQLRRVVEERAARPPLTEEELFR